MILIACSVRDLKAEVFARPFFVGRAGEAMRSFQDEVLSGDATTSLLAKHPADFELWELGSFDDELGVFTANGNGRLLARGSDFAK